MKKLFSFILVASMVLAVCMAGAYAAGPAASFAADAVADDTGKLSVTEITGTALGYQVGDDGTWTEITAADYTNGIAISGLANGSKINVSAVDTTQNPLVPATGAEKTTITVEKIAAPAAETFSKTPYVDADHKGSISGITSQMEYKKASDTAWTAGTGAAVTGLDKDTYYIRMKANGAKLASAATAVEITDPTTYQIWVGGTQVSNANNNNPTSGWTYDIDNGILTLNGQSAITGAEDGSAILIKEPTFKKINVTGNATVTSNNVGSSGGSYGLYIQSAVTANPVIVTGNGVLTLNSLSTTTDKPVANSSALASDKALTVEKDVTIYANAGSGTATSIGIAMVDDLNNSGKIYANGGPATASSIGALVMGNLTNTADGQINATSGSGTSLSTSLAISAGGPIVNSGAIDAHSGAAALSTGVFASDNIQNNSGATITAVSGNATDISTAIDATAKNIDNKGSIIATAGTAKESTAIIASSVKNTLSGAGVNANAANGTDSSVGIEASVENGAGCIIITNGKNSDNGPSYGILGNVNSNYGYITATSGTASSSSESNGIKGDVVTGGGSVGAVSGQGSGTGSYAINGALSVLPPENNSDAEVMANGKTGAISGAVTYKEGWTPEVKAGTAGPGTVVETPTEATYKEHFVHIQRKGSYTVTEVKITESLDLNLTDGQTGTITAVVTRSDGQTYTGPWQWTISDTSKASQKSVANNTITMQPVAEGTTVVTCTCMGVQSNECLVTVTATTPATGISIPEYSAVKVGGEVKLTAKLSPTGATGTVTWSTTSGGETIVKLKPNPENSLECTVTGVKNGADYIVATIDGTTTKSTCKFSVNPSGAVYKVTPYYGAWYYDKTDGYTFSVNTLNTISSVKINGVSVAFSPSSFSGGYQSVTIPYGTMSTLKHGYSQPLVITFADGTYVNAKIAIISTKDAPPTGDVNLIGYALMACASLASAGAAGIAVKKKKNR